MSEKVPLKEVLAAVDMNAKSMWKELDDDQRKALKNEFFILNRYISNVEGQKREMQEHFVLTVNEFFNKHWNTIQKHPELMWQLLCMCSHESKKIFFHKWIGAKKATSNNKVIKFLTSIYPNSKTDEIELLANISTKAELKALAKEYGYEDSAIKKMF